MITLSSLIFIHFTIESLHYLKIIYKTTVCPHFIWKCIFFEYSPCYQNNERDDKSQNKYIQMLNTEKKQKTLRLNSTKSSDHRTNTEMKWIERLLVLQQRQCSIAKLIQPRQLVQVLAGCFSRWIYYPNAAAQKK